MDEENVAKQIRCIEDGINDFVYWGGGRECDAGRYKYDIIFVWSFGPRSIVDLVSNRYKAEATKVRNSLSAG